jgi:hypothetical protein
MISTVLIISYNFTVIAYTKRNTKERRVGEGKTNFIPVEIGKRRKLLG